MTLPRPFTRPAATKTVDKLGDLILAAISTACEEEKAKHAYRAGTASRHAIDVCAKKALEAEKAMWRRLRQVAAEEIGGGAE